MDAILDVFNKQLQRRERDQEDTGNLPLRNRLPSYRTEYSVRMSVQSAYMYVHHMYSVTCTLPAIRFEFRYMTNITFLKLQRAAADPEGSYGPWRGCLRPPVSGTNITVKEHERETGSSPTPGQVRQPAFIPCLC